MDCVKRRATACRQRGRLEQDSQGKKRLYWPAFLKMAGATGLEPATYGVTGRHSNQLSYAPAGDGLIFRIGPI